MFRKSPALSLALAGAVTAALVAWAPVAEAQSRGISRPGVNRTPQRANIKPITRSSARPSFNAGRTSSVSRSNARPSGSALSRLGNTRGSSRARGGAPGADSGNGRNLNNLGALFNNARGNAGNYRGNGWGNGRFPIAEYFLGEYDRRVNYHDPYEHLADAYRDAAIANAVVNVAGIVSNAVVQSRQYRYQQPGYTAAAPAGPRGHVERQKVLVREGHYEEYTVEVPGHTVEATGERVLPHTERRQRWVEPVYETREVWVTEP